MIEEQEVRRKRRRRTPAEIQQIVSEFKSGDLTQKEFCRRQGLTLSTLGRYLSRGRASGEASNRGLVAVELAVNKAGTKACGGCGLSVSVGSGRRIVVEVGFDAASLQRLVQVLERM
jgi:transcriptional regulator with XRE-family HTH domain